MNIQRIFINMENIQTIKGVNSCLDSEKFLVLNRYLYFEFKKELFAKINNARLNSIQIVISRVCGFASGIRRKQKSYIRLYYLEKIIKELNLTLTERVLQTIERQLFKKESNLNQYKEYGFVFEEKTAHLKKRELRRFDSALDVKYKIYVTTYFNLVEHYNLYFESEKLRNLYNSFSDY